MTPTSHNSNFRLLYIQALRCWTCNNLKSCITICDLLVRKLRLFPDASGDSEMVYLKHQIWFLKIKCLADSYHLNESLLINEDDAGSDTRVVSVTARTENTARSKQSHRPEGGSRTITRDKTPSGIKFSHPQTGMISGRRSNINSRNSNRGLSSYRPLTTGLTSTKTAFSRSTRPLLKYSSSSLLSKLIFQYLYNAQVSTSLCPDYGQCLEYVNLASKINQDDKSKSKDTSESIFWLVASGICCFNLGMYKESEGHFRRACMLRLRYLDPYTWLIKIYLKQGQLESVLKVCDEAQRNCKSPILYNWMARVQSLLGDALVAQTNLRESLKLFPTNLEALANVGYFAFYNEEPELALRCFERIQQLSSSQLVCLDQKQELGESCQLLNNLALCYFYSGFYHKVIPLFMKSFLSSESKEMTSDIWYNLSFIPMGCGLMDMARACLELALNNDSQNLQAWNNLGVLKYKNQIEENVHFENMCELWSSSPIKMDSWKELSNLDDLGEFSAACDDAEVHFKHSASLDASVEQPEMLFNLALVNKRRGRLLDSVKYCNQYLEHDPENYQISSLLAEIKRMIFHDG